MDEMLQDFLTEASELLGDVDNKLVDLEKRPGDAGLLNDIFRGFHTIKGGAGFLNLTAMVDLCHLTENIFDKLRRNELQLNASIMDAILEATGVVRTMFDELSGGGQPREASASLLARLRAVISGEPAPQVKTTPASKTPAVTPAAKTPAVTPAASKAPAGTTASKSQPPAAKTVTSGAKSAGAKISEADWEAFFQSLTELPPTAPERGE